jgi:UDPglucose--hexose-1-phosphate uridylyltransferase
MPEMRFDALSGNFTIVATERSKRPSDFKLGAANEAALPERDERCPFCPGNEKETPPEIWANREAGMKDTQGWTVRVVPNKFPALAHRPEGAEEDERWRISPFPDSPEASLYWETPGLGSHEVVVESPSHNGTLGSYGREHMKSILDALKLRCLDLYDRKETAYVQVFKNSGKKAGASLAHPHFQIMALPVMPSLVSQEGQRNREYESRTRRCLVCDVVEREIEKDVRVVLKTEHFSVISPFASRYSYETMIVPSVHASSFTDLSDKLLLDLAGVMVRLFGAYESMFTDLPYNMVFHSLPPSVRDSRGWPYHAHIHVYPRLNTEAGLELGSGTFINPTPPELATKEFAAAGGS